MPSPIALWRLGPDGWAIELLGLTTGVHNPVFFGAEEERPVACDRPARPAWATTRVRIG